MMVLTTCPRARYPYKTQQKIQRLITNKNEAGLREISQHLIENTLYKIRFGSHNKQGIHGACPMEILHALLLGIFKYVRDVFFDIIGESSQLSSKFNALSKEYGYLISRQSERDFPSTRFANGIKRGKLMAQEYPGILLCMGAVFRSTRGRASITHKKSALTL